MALPTCYGALSLSDSPRRFLNIDIA